MPTNRERLPKSPAGKGAARGWRKSTQSDRSHRDRQNAAKDSTVPQKAALKKRIPKPWSQRNRASHSSGSRAPLAPSNQRSAAVQQEETLLAAVLRNNEEAMEALRAGELHRSYLLLSEALNEAQKNRDVALRGSPVIFTTGQSNHEAWQLAYAMTLSNLGCYLRRDGRAEQALACLRESQLVEVKLLGRPSCSTMLNLSAVLLGLGSSEEALLIAQSCVVCAQDDDPLLFITAIHNLAVALGQQPGRRERQAALPTMLRALRESQQHLGEAHPTTVMLRGKCGLTQPWIAASPVKSEQTERLPVALPPLKVSQLEKPRLPSIRAEIKTIDDAERSRPRANDNQRVSGTSQGCEARPAESSSGATNEALPDEFYELEEWWEEKKTFSSRAPLRAQTSATRDIGSTNDMTAESAGDLSENVSLSEVSPVKVVDPLSDSSRRSSFPFDGEDAVPASGTRSPLPSVALVAGGEKPNSAVDAPSASRLTGAVEEATECLASDYKSSPSSLIAVAAKRPTAESPHFCGEASPHLSALSAVLNTSPWSTAEPFEASSAVRTSRTASKEFSQTFLKVTARPNREDSSAIRLDAIASEPTFLRFCLPEDDVGEPLCTPPLNMYQRICDGIQRQSAERNKSPTVRSEGTEDIDQPHDTQKPVHKKATPSPLRRSLFHRKQAQPTRDALVEQQVRDEQEYREQCRIKKEEAEKESVFQSTLKRITERTRDRAARSVQHAWLSWWTAVGKPRHDLQLRRKQEQECRLRSRLAALSTAQYELHRSRRLSSETASRDASVQLVVKFGRRWLEKTVCVRYLAWRRIKNSTLDEQALRKLIARVQACWRGARSRRVFALHKQLFASRREHQNIVEAAYYAALVIQKLFRRVLAITDRQRLALQRYTPPARAIQRWYRQVTADQRARGVDTRTVERRTAAATQIQRTWRGYQRRLRSCISRLRDTIAASRRSEKDGVLCIQRVVRGFVTRVQLAELRMKRRRDVSSHSLVATSNTIQPAVSKKAFSESIMAERCVKSPTAYENDCLRRASLVAKIRDAEREQYDVPLYLEPAAARERQEWIDSIRLRPLDVARQRSAEELQLVQKAEVFRRARAALRIQREFRSWLRIRHGPYRDDALLQLSRLHYQRDERQRQRDASVHRKGQEQGCALYGDLAQPMRHERMAAQRDIFALEALQADNTNASPIRSGMTRTADELALRQAERRTEKLRRSQYSSQHTCSL